MKKLLIFVLVLVLCLPSFAACDIGGNPAPDDGTQTQSSTDQTEKREEPTEEKTVPTEETTTVEEETTIVSESVSLDKVTITLINGSDETLTATVNPADVTDKSLTWSSSDESVATVSDGVVTAVSAGTATITVTTANGKTATCSVTVITNGISFKSLGINGTDVYGKVSNTSTTFSFLNEINTSVNTTFEVYQDLECTAIIRSKTASLLVGDNTFYILEYFGGEVNALYTVTVRRRPMYTVTFNTMGGTSVVAQTVEEDSFATIPATEREGYAFAGWDRDLTLPIVDNTEIKAQWTGLPFVVTYDANTGTVGNATTNVVTGLAYDLDTPTKTGYTFEGWYYGTRKIEITGTWDIAEDVTITAKWRANTNTAYKVEHYIEMLDGSYELKDTDNLTGTTDSEVTPNTKCYTGFTAPEKQTVTILPDGTLCVRYDYTRNSYTVTFVTNGGEAIADQTLQYEAALPTPQRSGYTFGGWFSDVNLSTSIVTVPAQNITLYAYWTEENKPSDFTYSGSSSITITKYNSSDSTVKIPSYIGGMAVTRIESSAFGGCSTLTSITIPSSVTSIGKNAFDYCHRLKSVTFAENSQLTSIGGAAFRNCSELTSITLPSSVTRILNYAFAYCSGLASITFAEDSQLTSIGEDAFNGCSELTRITIPSNVTSIGKHAFDGCSNLIQKENGISYVDKWVIDCDSSVEEATLLGDTVGIGNYAFSDCSNLANITIPDSVTSIGNYAFSDCSNLTSITIPDSVTSIGDHAFDGCSGLTSITIPNSVTNIGGSAFYRCSGLTSITIPNCVTSIENCAFEDCSGLTSVTIPDSVTSIGYSAFDGCSGLKSVYYSGTPTQWENISIGSYNSKLTNSTLYYYSVTEPTDTQYNYWYYDANGNPTKW